MLIFFKSECHVELSQEPHRGLSTSWQLSVKSTMLFIHPVNGNPFCAAEYYRNSNCMATFSFQQTAACSVKRGALDVHFHTLPSEPRDQPQYISLLYSSSSHFFMATDSCCNQSDNQGCAWAAVDSFRGCSRLSSCCSLSRPFLDRCVWWMLSTRSSSSLPDDIIL